MTDLLTHADVTTADGAAGRVLPRFDVVAAESPADSLRREHEVIDALPDCPHTDHAAPDTLRAGDPVPASGERAVLSEAMCGCPVSPAQV